MEIDLTAALAVAMVVGVWQLLHWRPAADLGALPDVGDAPPDAEPIVTPHFNDNGLGAYSLELPASRFIRADG